jgi:uncharacterized membrane protein
VLEWICDKLGWIIAYMLLPITYPIYYFQQKKERKIAQDRKNALAKRNSLR